MCGTVLTPTALPRKKKEMHKAVKEVLIVDKSPNRDVKNNVALNAILRPSRSEPAKKVQNGVLRKSDETYMFPIPLLPPSFLQTLKMIKYQ